MHPKLAAARLILLQYRRHLAVLIMTLFAWSLLNGAHKGQQIVVSAAPIAAGQPVTEAQVALAWLDGPSIAGFVTEPSEVVGKALLRSLAPDTPLLRSDLQLGNQQPERVVVDLPLDAGAGAEYASGTTVHVWAVGEEGAWLLSSDGIVVGLLGGALGDNRVVLSLPRDAESAAMSALAVRLAVVSRGAAVG